MAINQLLFAVIVILMAVFVILMTVFVILKTILHLLVRHCFLNSAALILGIYSAYIGPASVLSTPSSVELMS